MSGQGHYHSSPAGDLAYVMLVMAFVVAAVSIYIACRTVVFIYYTFEKYPKVKALYYSLAVCIGLWLVGGILASLTEQPGFLGVLCPGILQLVLVCAIVRRQQATTFMKERLDFNIVEAMTKRKWFADDTERIAA
jgi:hypothetical protein